MKFCNQDISKTITAMCFKLGQLIEHKKIYLVIALCKFGENLISQKLLS